MAAARPTRQQLLLAMQEQELTLAAYDVVIVCDNDPVPVERLWAAISSMGGPHVVGVAYALATCRRCPWLPANGRAVLRMYYWAVAPRC